jgi:hypothetical protein
MVIWPRGKANKDGGGANHPWGMMPGAGAPVTVTIKEPERRMVP